ncbi:MAG: hypothetical protein JXQ99_13520 [Hyphomicrobiaceae bacterium]
MSIDEPTPFYKSAAFDVREDLAEVHRAQLADLGSPGTWGSGAQRLAVASEVRLAGVEAGVMEAPAGGVPAADVTLPETVRAFIGKLAVSPKDVDEAACDAARSEGLSDEEYVEIVGIVSRVVNLDIFARGIGSPLQPLPTARAGQPSGVRPQAAVREHAIVPTVPNAPEGGHDAEVLYGGKWQPYIMRALSLVPGELSDHLELEEVQYMPMSKVLVPDHQHHNGVTRAQAEVVAGRVSAINECFF